MEKFGSLYDNLSSIYSELESIMGALYGDLQNDPTNMAKVALLQDLGNVANKMLSSQMEFVESYGDPQFKDNLLTNLGNRKMSLLEALALDKERLR